MWKKHGSLLADEAEKYPLQRFDHLDINSLLLLPCLPCHDGILEWDHWNNCLFDGFELYGKYALNGLLVCIQHSIEVDI